MIVSVPILCWAIASSGVTPLLRADFIRALLLVAVSTGIMFACALLVWMLAYRLLRVRHIQQDGTMCPNCGYCIQHLLSATCPECGESFDRAHLAAILDRKSRRPVGRTWKRAVWIVAVVVAVLVTGYHWRRGSITSLTLLNPLYWGHVVADNSAHGGTYRSELAWQLDKEMLTPDEVRSIVGPPDLFLVDDTGTYYIYEYRTNGIDMIDYVDFIDGQPVRVGVNRAGVNDHSRYKRWAQKRGVTTPAPP